MTLDDRYERVTFHGKTVDRWTMAALLEAERQLGYELTIVQGSYNNSVSASAGTHVGGGVVDLAPWDWKNKVRVLRELGFAAWHRTPSQGPWGEHVHAVLIGNTSAAASALRQVEAYKQGRNGLANSGPDDGPKTPIHSFPYTPPAAAARARPTRTRITHARHKLALVQAELSATASLLRASATQRPGVRTAIPLVRAASKSIPPILRALPKS